MPYLQSMRSLKTRILDDLSEHRVRYIKTACLMLCWVQVGLNMGVVGPTLIDLMIQTDADLTMAALIMPFRSGGYAIGAFVCGFIYDYVNWQLLSVITMTIAGISCMVIPFLHNIWTILVFFLAIGISFGAYEAGTDMFILQIWGPSK